MFDVIAEDTITGPAIQEWRLDQVRWNTASFCRCSSGEPAIRLLVVAGSRLEGNSGKRRWQDALAPVIADDVTSLLMVGFGSVMAALWGAPPE